MRLRFRCWPGNDEELVRCRAVEQVEEDAYWRDDFSFPITFYEYGAGEYQLGEIIVGGAELTDFTQLTKLAQQYGAELLRSMGLSEEEYEVEEIVWAGTPYENEDSIVCRDAVARGNRLLRDYQVVYEGVVEPERWKELKRGGAPGELDEAQMQEEPAWEEAEETAGAKVETEAARPEEAEKQPEVKKSGLPGISGKGDQNPADCGGNRSHLLFWRTSGAGAALDLPEAAGVACAETVKERLAAGRNMGFA